MNHFIKMVFMTIGIVFLVGCEEEKVYSQEEIRAYLKSFDYIDGYKDGDEEGSLVLIMDKDFKVLELSEQYIFLKNFYNEYKKMVAYGELSSLDVWVIDNVYFTYSFTETTFDIIALGESFEHTELENHETSLNVFDSTLVWNGKYHGETYEEKKSDPTYVASGGDTETYIEGMDGHEWTSLTSNQKFHAVSNALYALDSNGYEILETEYFYIEALDSFYTDENTWNTPVNESLVSIGLLSNSIRK